MFDNFVVAKTPQRRRWKSLLISFSIILHAAGLVALLIYGFWVIEKLPLPKREVTIAVAPPPPPPPPPPAPSKKKVETKPDPKIKRVKPMDTTQPVDKKVEDEDVEIEIVEDYGIEGGVEGGVAGGMIGGVVGGVLEGVPGGVIEAPPPPPPPPPPAKPAVVPQVAVEAKRIAGEKSIQPDDTVKIQMQRDGKSRVVSTYRMCLTKAGTIASINMVKSSGYPDYDRKINSKMREWRYQPFIVNGEPSPVCTMITFIYSQR
ncbi:energy transducer TonB [Haliangium ochraceum]|uniref:Putative TonB protein n=1 Tax=Haliangium ochraceum (strain DSM 14365 / JCM 11303 / SMP-2) TaxID=502025 RepID=D0LJZ7_HALO1|nr:energy transducer TonB [Haliangium ochraceum]ACY18504.1 putative TonB protein [Haliangium ochraceum DSM 14365]